MLSLSLLESCEAPTEFWVSRNLKRANYGRDDVLQPLTAANPLRILSRRRAGPRPTQVPSMRTLYKVDAQGASRPLLAPQPLEPLLTDTAVELARAVSGARTLMFDIGLDWTHSCQSPWANNNRGQTQMRLVATAHRAKKKRTCFFPLQFAYILHSTYAGTPDETKKNLSPS